MNLHSFIPMSLSIPDSSEKMQIQLSAARPIMHFMRSSSVSIIESLIICSRCNLSQVVQSEMCPEALLPPFGNWIKISIRLENLIQFFRGGAWVVAMLNYISLVTIDTMPLAQHSTDWGWLRRSLIEVGHFFLCRWVQSISIWNFSFCSFLPKIIEKSKLNNDQLNILIRV